MIQYFLNNTFVLEYNPSNYNLMCVIFYKRERNILMCVILYDSLHINMFIIVYKVFYSYTSTE